MVIELNHETNAATLTYGGMELHAMVLALLLVYRATGTLSLDGLAAHLAPLHDLPLSLQGAALLFTNCSRNCVSVLRRCALRFSQKSQSWSGWAA